MNVFRIGYSDAKGSRRQTLRTGEPTSYARPLLEWSVSSARVVIFTLIALVIVWYGVQIGLIGSDEPVEEEGGVAGSRRGQPPPPGTRITVVRAPKPARTLPVAAIEVDQTAGAPRPASLPTAVGSSHHVKDLATITGRAIPESLSPSQEEISNSMPNHVIACKHGPNRLSED